MQLIENSARPLHSQSDKFLSGLFAEMGTLNQNGRCYPEDIYEQAYEELVPKIREKRLLGELDHPIDYDEVRLSNVSHVITECYITTSDGVKKVYGTVELLDTPAGLIAQALVRAGIPLGISSRGIGSVQQDSKGIDEVTQLKLITYDLVADPSFANAVLSPDKSQELSDSLKYIESKLPLNEAVETRSVRSLISNIRESLLSKKTIPAEEVDINKVEINSLRKLLDSAQVTIKSDTERMIESREEIKSLQEKLHLITSEYKELQKNMFKLQDAYNALVESAPTREQIDELSKELVETKKQLAVEKRGMSYGKVSDLLEGATTSEDIESRLNSLSSISKKRQSKITISKETLTESGRLSEKKLTGLAHIISRV